MYSKSPLIATGLLCALAASCISLPWRNEPVGQEVNLAFTMENNLLFLSSATIDGKPGRFLFGSAEPRTVIDPSFLRGSTHAFQLGDKQSVRVQSVEMPLQGVGDAIVGADVIGTHAVTVDYVSGLVTYQKEGIHPDLMTVFSYANEPTINVSVDEKSTAAVVDTASPDTLVLPGAPGRRNAHVQIAGTDFGSVDVRLANVSKPRVGNRLLSRFLVTIDYGRKHVGLWRDPRVH